MGFLLPTRNFGADEDDAGTRAFPIEHDMDPGVFAASANFLLMSI